MKFIIQILLCLVIRGLADFCRNGNSTLSSCLSNPSIRIEKTQRLSGRIRGYQLSLRFQNTWWAALAEKDEWIECDNLCRVCQSLPGIDEDGESIGQPVY